MINIAKMSSLLKAMNRLDSTPIKILGALFTEIEKKSIMHIEYNRLQIDKTRMRKKIKVGGITLSDLKLYYKAIVIKTVQYFHKNRLIYQ